MEMEWGTFVAGAAIAAAGCLAVFEVHAKKRRLLPAEELFRHQAVVDVFDARFCAQWFREQSKSYSGNLVGYVCAAQKEVITDILGFTYPEDFSPQYYAVLILADDAEENSKVLAWTLVNFKSVDEYYKEVVENGKIQKVQIDGDESQNVEEPDAN